MRGTQPFGFTQGCESFGFSQDRESFDSAQDRKLVERPVERPVERQMDVFQQPVRFSRGRTVLSLAVLI